MDASSGKKLGLLAENKKTKKAGVPAFHDQPHGTTSSTTDTAAASLLKRSAPDEENSRADEHVGERFMIAEEDDVVDVFENLVEGVDDLKLDEL
eukprot:GSA120T00018875001.1